MPAARSFKTTSEAINLPLFRPCHQQELQAVALPSLYFRLCKDPSKKTLFFPPPDGALRHPVSWFSLMDCGSPGNTN